MSAPPLIDYGRMLELLRIEGRLLLAATKDAPHHAQVGGVSGFTVERTVRSVSESVAEAAKRITEPASLAGACSSHPVMDRPARRFDGSALPDESRSADALPASDLPESDLPESDLPESDLPESALFSEAEPVGLLASRLAGLLAEFGTRDAHQPCSTWQPGADNIGFWLRRVLHTTAVHRVDVQTAALARPTEIEPDLARDGIDEMLHLWFGCRLNAMGATASSGWSIRIEVDDHRWFAGSDPPRMRAQRLDGPGDSDRVTDAVVTGDAASTYLWLWGRLPDRAVRVSGDYDAVAQLWSLLRLATR